MIKTIRAKRREELTLLGRGQGHSMCKYSEPCMNSTGFEKGKNVACGWIPASVKGAEED